MNEVQWEMLKNIATNPYTWVFLGFIFGIGYFMQYIRRFYPKSWQEAMIKEEACSLEYHKKPEMKLVRKITNIGFLSILFISYVLSFHLLTDLVNPLDTFKNIFLSGAVFIMLISIYYQSKIKKDKNCSNVIVGYKYIKIVGIVEIIIFIILLIIFVLKELKVF